MGKHPTDPREIIWADGVYEEFLTMCERDGKDPEAVMADIMLQLAENPLPLVDDEGHWEVDGVQRTKPKNGTPVDADAPRRN